MFAQLITLGLISSLNSFLDKKELEQKRKKFESIMSCYCDTLLQKKEQLVYTDDYGVDNWNGFDKEAKHFIKNIIYGDSTYRVSQQDLSLFYEILKDPTFSKTYSTKKISYKSNNKSKSNIKSGIDYENYVFEILQNTIYDVRKTPATGDQGVDLIVSYKEKKCAIQCKFYSSSVGNKAVQEIVAGQGYYSCDYAVVCSNNVFTKSAYQLAKSFEVNLVTDDNIIDCLDKLFNNKTYNQNTNDNEYDEDYNIKRQQLWKEYQKQYKHTNK